MVSVFFTIYKITNKVNGKIYIGKHQTNDINDGYMGSGKLIRAAIKKYGVENFEKQVLYKFDTEAEMNEHEANLVTEEFCTRSDTYNLCPGGQGGFGFINQNVPYENRGWAKFRKDHPDKVEAILKENGKRTGGDNLREAHAQGKIKYNTFKGRSHSEDTKKKMRKPKNQGSNNPQFGSMWITNGIDNKKVKRVDEVPKGWYKGRTLRANR